MNSPLVALFLVTLLTSCDNVPKPAGTLTCKDSPRGHSKAEKNLIAEACFRKGRFKKSLNKEW